MADFEMPPQAPLQMVDLGGGSYSIEDNGIVRALLFVGEEKALVVDSTQGGGGSLRELLEQITDKPLMLVNTHSDPDHTAMNHEFDVAWMHPAEMARYHGEKGDRALPVAPLQEGDVIDIGGRAFEVVLIPGHTPGSIALLDRANRMIVVGDTVSATPVFLFGDGRDLDAYLVSLDRLAALKSAFDEVYPSHGPCPLDSGAIDRQIAAADKLAAGELEPVDPPFPLPAKMFMHEGAGFFYD